MSKATKFLAEIRGKDADWLRAQIITRDDQIRTLKFDLGFGTVDALSKLRAAKRERAQLLTVLREINTAAKAA